MTNPQGTQWETQIVNRAYTYNLQAGRYPKMASQHEPDVWIGEPGPGVPAVFWKRLVGTKAEGRRKPDGEPEVVILSVNDFLYLLYFARKAEPVAVQVQAKWTTNLNVTRTLSGLRQWLKARLVQL